jgi:sterol desaturase/sphingolipid hydroxylase (fatty acid hydroxylase superfamily)
MRKAFFSLFQPATLVVIVLFWTLAPAPLANNPWTIFAAVTLTKAMILALERVNERHASWRLDRRELLTDLFYVILAATLIKTARKTLADAPLKSLKLALGISTPWLAHLPFLVQVALIIFLIEFGQYWMHRLMHNNTAFWLTHAPHHHVTQLNALKGAVGNPIELFLVGLSVITLFDFSLVALFCAGNILTAVASFAHANVRFDPPRWYAYFFTTIEHHSLHHSTDYESTRCNYANSLILCDRMCGTFREGEAELVGQDERKRLSIREQFVFPFVPVIAMIKARHGRSAAV